MTEIESAEVARRILQTQQQLLEGQTKLLDQQKRLLAAVCRLERLNERQVDLSADAVFAAFLERAAALMNADDPWTCDELMDAARFDASPEGVLMLGVLRELNATTAKQLGNYLRSRVGGTAGGHTLCQHRVNRSGVRTWSVTIDA